MRISNCRNISFLSQAAIAGLLLFYGALLMLRGITLGEGLTFFVIEDGLRSSFERAFQYQGQSPFYFCLLAAFRSIVGDTLFWWRVPSLCCTFASAFALQAIAKRLGSVAPDIARNIFLVLALFTAEGILLQARPYALAMLMLLLSLLMLVRYVQSSQSKFLLGHLAAFVAMTYSSYLFALSFPVFASALLMYRRQRLKSIILFLVVHLLALVAYLPLADQIALVVERKEAWSYLNHVSILDVVFPSYLLIALIGLLIANGGSCFTGMQRLFSKGSLRTAAIGALWCYLPNLAALALENCLHTSIFSPKYLIWGLPGTALLGSATLSEGVFKRIRSTHLVIALAVGLWGARGQISFEGWHAVADKISATTEVKSPCVLVYAGLVEQNWSRMYESEELRAELVSPLRYYLRDAIMAPLPFTGWDLRFDVWFKSNFYQCDELVAVIAPGPPIINSSGARIDISDEVEAHVLNHGFKLKFEDQASSIAVRYFSKVRLDL